MGQLVVQNECVCSGHQLTLQCTVVGAGATVWRGSAFSSCTGAGSSDDEMLLRHSSFSTGGGTTESCNRGAIIGRGLRGIHNRYTSQLTITLDASFTLEGKTVECVYDTFTQKNLIVIGNYTIIYNRGMLNHMRIMITQQLSNDIIC